jgi:xanthine dehydrogenase accessory factor
VDDAAAAAAGEQLWAGRSQVRELPGGVRAFVEVLEPPLRLVICGAGHDAIPLVELAAGLGWKPVVVDDRERFLNAERFPSAASFVQVERPADAGAAVALDERTAVIVMSHNYLRDVHYVKGFLGTPVAYLGVLGPTARRDRLLADLARDGVEPSKDDLEKMHGPAGLDLGGDGPEEIAAAIVAEILAVRRGRSGGFLRDRPGPIHERSEDSGAWR